MNQSQQVERARDAVGAYVETIDIPQYNERAVRARASSVAPRRTVPRWAAAAAACVLLVAVFTATPTVRAQVEHMLQAFAVIGGQQVPVAVNDVTLDQARRDMPFSVVAPAAIPAGFTPRIDELTPSSSRLDARLVFRYQGSGNVPGLTIMESRATSGAPEQMKLWMTAGSGTPPHAPAAMNNLPPGQHAFVQFRSDGTVTQRVRVEPITWVVHGTRVDLISPPGLLTPMQLAAIRRAMSH